MGRLPVLSRFVSIVFVLICVGYVFHRQEIVRRKVENRWDVSSWIKSDSSSQLPLQPPCDPYLEPGHLFTSDELYSSRYIIYNDQKDPTFSSPDEDWVVPSMSADLHEQNFEKLEFMRNRTVLMIGDSIDRNLVTHFGRRALAGTQGTHKVFVPPAWAKNPVVKQPNHQIGIAHSPELNFTMYNWFLMGLTVKEEVPFFHAREDLPQKFEARLETLFLPILRKSLLPRPDLVVFNTGFWDLEYLTRSRSAGYKLDGIEPRREEGPTNLKSINRGDGNPMGLSELAYHRNRLREFINFIRSALHDIDRDLGDQGRPIGLMYRSMQLGNTIITGAFAPEKIMQLDESNRMVMKEFGIPVIEWGKMSIGATYQLDDQSIHYGIGSVQYIFGDMLLFYLKRQLLGTKDEWAGCDWIRHRHLSHSQK